MPASRPLLQLATASRVEKQLDQLQGLVTAIFVAAVLIILADAAAEKEVKFLGLDVPTNGGYAIAAVAFLFIVFTFCQLTCRIADLVRCADEEETPDLIAGLFTHPSSLNPFSYFGPSRLSLFHSSFGPGLLTFVWWMGLLAFALLWNRSSYHESWDVILWYLYIAAGVLSLAGMLQVYYVIDRKLAGLTRRSSGGGPGLLVSLRYALIAKCVVWVLFFGFGYMIYYQLTHIGM